MSVTSLSITDCRLTSPVRDLSFLTELRGLITRWKEVGDHLGVPASELDVIQENNHARVHPTENCLRDMFLWWLRTDGNDVTARKLVKVAHEIGEHTTEAVIKQEFGKEIKVLL